MNIIPIEAVLATKGNLAVFGVGGGTKVWDCVNCENDGVATIVPAPGQPVFWDADTGKTVAAADVCKVRIMKGGIPIDTDGDGIANYIQEVTMGYMRPCDVEDIQFEVPVCGTAPKVDMLMDCLKSGKTYSIKVKWIDDRTQSRQDQGFFEEYTITFKVASDPCVECPDSFNCKSAICEIINIVSNKKPKSGIQRFFGKSVGLTPKDLPFDIVALEEFSYQWCFTPIADACEGCTTISRILSITIDGVTTAFTNSQVPGDATHTYDAQLDGIICQINTLLGTKAATLNRSQACCPVKLEINSCKVITLNTTANAPIAVCTPTVNPLDPVAYANACGVCYDNGSTKTFTCGIRIIGKPIRPVCNYKLQGNELGYLGMQLEGEFVAGFEDAFTYTRVVTKGTIPKNLGYQWQYRQYRAEVQTGRDDTILRGDPPYGQGRIDNVTVSCPTSYCSMQLTRSNRQTDQNTHGTPYGPKTLDTWLVPKADLVTMLSLQTYLNAIAACGNCPTKPSGFCVVDGDPDVMTSDWDPETPGIGGPHGGLIR